MTDAQRRLMVATSYMDILANEAARRMLQDLVDAVNAKGIKPEGCDRLLDDIIEVYFGVKTIDLDPLPLKHARAEVKRAFRRMLTR